MKQGITFSAILFLAIVRLNAQSDYRNGYVIKNDNDTIYGLINYRGNKSNSKMCVFKKDANSEKHEFTPNDIKAYRFINSKYYISKPIKSDDNSETFLFFEYLINGTVDIFYYRDDELGEHYFVDFGDGSYHELKNEKKEVMVNNTSFIKESKEYTGILKYSFRKSPAIAKRVDNISLDHQSLIKIAHDYHNEVCEGEACIIYEKKLPKVVTKFGPLVGVNFTSISKYDGFSDDFYYFYNSQFKQSVYPSIGMFIRVNMPGLNERLHFQYEASYGYKKHSTTNRYIEPVYNLSYTNNITLAQHTLCNSGLIRYEFPKGKVRPTFQFGGFLNYFLKVDYTRNLEIKYSWGEIYGADEIKENPFSKIDYGICLGLGLIKEMSSKREFSIDLKYQRGYGLLYGMNSNYLSLNVGFQIGR